MPAKSAKPSSSPPAKLEYWTIFEKATGDIAGSGYGPAGSGALQLEARKNPAEAVTVQASTPEFHRVDVTCPDFRVILKTAAVPHVLQVEDAPATP